MAIRQVAKTPWLKPKYPYLGISHANGLIVLFSDVDTGTVVGGGENIGEFLRDMWYEDGFTPYEGSITLENA